MDQSQPTEQEGEVVPHCYWHPGVETRLSCSRCGKPVCTQCMVQAPVGIRCRDCGKAVQVPTFNVQPTHYTRALLVGAAVSVGGGLLWALLNKSLFGAIPLLPSLVAIGVGYAAGELISLSVNRKRGIGLAWIAGGSVVGAFLISWLISDFSYGLLGLLFIFLGVLLAAYRVR
jgi:hypothetical protein